MISTDHACVAKRCVLCTYQNGMSFSVWDQEQQLWEGVTGTETCLLSMKRRKNQQQLETAGAVSFLETILKLFKVRDKATWNVKQQPSVKSAAVKWYVLF